MQQILSKTINITAEQKQLRITPNHLMLASRSDSDLNTLVTQSVFPSVPQSENDFINADELLKLDEVFNHGMISEDEYQKRKSAFVGN